MDQVTTGIRRMLSRPIVYDTFQSMLGGASARRRICAEHIKARDSDTVVDVGCGTAELLKFLPRGIRYYGFDLSQTYVDAAKLRFAGRGNYHFRCADLNTLGPEEVPPCDLAIAFGVLHHINDNGARGLMETLFDRLAPGGRVVTIDCAFVDDQAFIARELIRRDRGQHVRRAEDYLSLVPDSYKKKTIAVHHDLLRVPYTHVIMECVK